MQICDTSINHIQSVSYNKAFIYLYTSILSHILTELGFWIVIISQCFINVQVQMVHTLSKKCPQWTHSRTNICTTRYAVCKYNTLSLQLFSLLLYSLKEKKTCFIHISIPALNFEEYSFWHIFWQIWHLISKSKPFLHIFVH